MENKRKSKIVWQFTNKRKLDAEEFVDYFERKVKGTIRKYKMPIGVVRGKSLKVRVINNIVKNLMKRKGKLSDESLNDVSNKVIYAIIYRRGDELKKLVPKNKPLYFLSDAEIELYAKIKKIKGKLINEELGIKRELKEIDDFISLIEKKSPDIRHNVVEALLRAFY